MREARGRTAGQPGTAGSTFVPPTDPAQERLILHPPGTGPWPDRGGPVIYWMQAAQRTVGNPALDVARAEAMARGRAFAVVFVLSPVYGVASLRHYWFMVEGLGEVDGDLALAGIHLSVYLGHPPAVVATLARTTGTPLVVTDRGHTRVQKAWRAELAQNLGCPYAEVETETVVPVELAYPRQAWSAAVLRPALRRLAPGRLAHPPALTPFQGPLAPIPDLPGMARIDLRTIATPADLAALLPGLPPVPGPVAGFHGGRSHALSRLDAFKDHGLSTYGSAKNDPSLGGGSGLSPWLHFGQISAQEVIVTLAGEEPLAQWRSGRRPFLAKAGPEDGLGAFVEEILVRRELAINYCHFQPDHDRYQGLPAWALATLAHHRSDPRPWVYRPEDLLQARTHDRWWNACQVQMVETGAMHGYMRMYWGKKILEWTVDPAEAFALALSFNDTWELDGRDPNGYVGVAWCFGLHDRPWAERPVFGTVRYMNNAGLERKFDMEAYGRLWDR